MIEGMAGATAVMGGNWQWPRRAAHRGDKPSLTQAALQAHHQSLPKSRHGHSLHAPNKVPDKFHTLVDPDKNPPQPWRDACRCRPACRRTG